MRSLLMAAVLLLTVAARAFAADPVGAYDVQGTSPGGSDYTGTVKVTKTGQTYKIVWEIGDTRYTGTAIGDNQFLAITYKSEGETGLALYGADGGNWKGIWTHSGGNKTGREMWKRQ